MRKIEKEFGSTVSLERLNESSETKSFLIYCTSIDVQKAITNSYNLGSKDVLDVAAQRLRSAILASFRNVELMKWPPTIENLTVKSVLPFDLTSFLTKCISGKDDRASERVHRLVNSLGQDICRAVTNGEWKLPKHVLLCMTLRHLFRSKQLTTLLNRFGHCENHSFS